MKVASSDLTGELLAALLAAPAERKEAALRLLRGEPTVALPRPTEPFLTLKECARRLGFSACALWRWRVPGHTLGGRPRFRVSEVEAYLGSEEFKRRVAELKEEDRERRGRKSSDQSPVISGQ